MPETYIHLFLFGAGGVMGMVAVLWALLSIFASHRRNNAPRPSRRRRMPGIAAADMEADAARADGDNEALPADTEEASAAKEMLTAEEREDASPSGGAEGDSETGSAHGTESPSGEDAGDEGPDAETDGGGQAADAPQGDGQRRKRRRKRKKKLSKSVQRLYDNYSNPSSWTDYMVENLDDLDSVVAAGRSKEDGAYNMVARDAAKSKVSGS